MSKEHKNQAEAGKTRGENQGSGNEALKSEKGKTEEEQKTAGAKGRSSGSQPSAESRDVPIIGLGASAGGLDALKAFFSKVPRQSGLAYIVLMHLSPDQPSMLPELLQKVSVIPAAMAEDGETLKADHIYVVPPRKEVSIYESTIQLMEVKDTVASMPIDYFFRTLAADKKSRTAAVILSGTGSDGSVGLKDIKSNDGLVLVQSSETAKYDGMPWSAQKTGLADMVLDPGDMPEKLCSYFDRQGQVDKEAARKADNREPLHKIFAMLRVQVGHDFSNYKTKTIQRRINRRMILNQIGTYEEYLRFLRENSNEIESLFRELLIGVTNFFRDPESFAVLKKDILPDKIASLQDDSTFRVWIPGCSSGEEAYSLAIVLCEVLDKLSKRITLQLFGTDIDRQAIDKAREGYYPSSIKADVSQERLERFFYKEGEGYRIRKHIRESMIFSVQDVLKDPPFSRLNLLCCRNLLIYLKPEAQKKLLPLFHYTLLPQGLLVLGSSETVGGFTNLFHCLNSSWKIYQRREIPDSMRERIEFPTGKPGERPQEAEPGPSPSAPKANLEKLTRDVLLQRFSPSGVLVDTNGVVQHVLGRTGKYLEPASGPPSQNILDMAREGLRVELSMALRKAASTQEEVIRRQVRVKSNGATQPIDLHVLPLTSPKELAGRLLVVFEDVETEPKASEYSRGDHEQDDVQQYEARIEELEDELQITRENHQTTVEELESSNEELKSTNEELQSSNEELQSTNEEMESSKEELQSLNEELETVNSELQSKVEELSEAHDDITNLLNATEIATIFVDNDLRIKRFSKEAAKIINLIDSDIGRPLKDQSTRLRKVNIIKLTHQVLENLTPVEKEVQSQDEIWYRMRIRPYRTSDNSIRGAVLTFMDVDEQKKSMEQLKTINEQQEQAWFLVRSIFDMSDTPKAVLNDQKRIVIANSELCRLAGLEQKTMEGRSVFELETMSVKSTDLQSKLDAALQEERNFDTSSFQVDTPDGKKTLSIQGRIIPKSRERPYRILLCFCNQTSEA